MNTSVSEILKTKTGAQLERMELKCQALPDSNAFYGLKPYGEVQPITDVTRGLCEGLKNIQKYRLFMHEEIRDILNRQALEKRL